ncbi:N-acetylmuramoyl-L-alanine amidase [Gemmatimonas groenlandica]|uniref:N-acetylmuramoyl-L-alanine amidase n=1 Tax=Gemmatimonas groenlandica TaxID=2732249 RepID=A0A6M4IPH2_9BACT|nr:N-acetylmuramoyl-L-alanine amidase [Gemmatimonas groenlandica]QJR35848.1 N-acetylmuramoyl-L-alanine amidase [Gemmatimonas groenlandica]
MQKPSSLVLLGAVLVVSACARPTTVVTPPTPMVAPPAIVAGLPAVPAVRGAPIDVRVRYPAENQLLTSRDSNFVLGSIGTGDVSLTINGQAVPVAPNGAFLAWLPNPPAGALRYDVVVARTADTVRRTVKVRLPVRTTLPGSGKLRVDSGSVLPVRGMWAKRDDYVRVSLRAPANAIVMVQGSDSVLRPLVRGTGLTAAPTVPAGDGNGDANRDDMSSVFSTDLAARLLADSARAPRLVAIRGADTVRLAVPIIRALPADTRVLAMLRSTSTIGSDTDRVVNARTIVDGTYKWMLLNGTIVEVTGRAQGYTRIRLDGTLDVWVDNNDLVLLPEGAAMPRRVTGGFRVTPSAEWVDVAISTGDRPAHLVEPDGRTLVLTLYGVQANPEISPIFGNDTLVRRISWDQVTSDRVRITLTLSQPVFGWQSIWDDSRRQFVLRVRRPPLIDAANPLRGLTIAVDPGHPPAGATGPTGLYEGDAVFPVGEQVAALLRARGANVVMTRTSLAPVGLTERGVTARRANAHAFISIHLNALPDGVNPFTANGTSTLFYHQNSEPLARPVQDELMKRFGLRDLGVHYQNLAVARPTWYPSALAEGLFLMLPEQEAAMRDAGFQRKYAEGLVVGLERYFRIFAPVLQP